MTLIVKAWEPSGSRQLFLAAVSGNGLASGSAKPTPKERKRFYSIAFASLRETQSCLTLISTGYASGK